MHKAWRFAIILTIILIPITASAQRLTQQQTLATQKVFATNCSGCHGEDARGTAKGPSLAMNPRVAEQTAGQLSAFLKQGNIAAGMPSFADLPAEDWCRSPDTCAVSIRNRSWGPDTGRIYP